jgi:crossover junction endodeoxyribonuclease RuvC
MIVLGIDPGSANTGFGVVAVHGGRLVALDGGVIKAVVLADIYERVSELLDEHQPAAVAVEELYFGANARTAFAVGQARGVAVLAAEQRRIPHRAYTPQQIKAAVCGSGRAEKDQVQRMVQSLLSLDRLPRPDHAADALAVAICDLNGEPVRASIGPGLARREQRRGERAPTG